MSQLNNELDLALEAWRKGLASLDEIRTLGYGDSVGNGVIWCCPQFPQFRPTLGTNELRRSVRQ